MAQTETLLQETVETLAINNKSPADVKWVGVLERGWNERVSYHFSWDEFAAAAEFRYNSSYGGQNVEASLVVVGDAWWLERGEYDGSEWWEFKTLPTKPDKHIQPAEIDIKSD